MSGPRYDKPERCPEDGGEFKVTFHPQFGRARECMTCTVRQWLDSKGNAKGTPANVFLRRARMDAHKEFDALWKSGFMKREEAYAWLGERLGIVGAVHMAEMDTITCTRVTKISREEVARFKSVQSSAAKAAR